MSHDKLNLTARAAGFAMAFDETAGGPVSRQVSAQPTFAPEPRAEAPRTRTSTALVAIRAARPSMGFGFIGWNFWKTA